MTASVTPPAGRTALWQPLTEAAATRRFVLQSCGACGTVQYPPREVCRNCLGAQLLWKEFDSLGTLLAATTLHVSNEPWFASRTPWRIGAVKLDLGVKLTAHLDPSVGSAGARVRVWNALDRSGQSVFVAAADGIADADARIRSLLDLD